MIYVNGSNWILDYTKQIENTNHTNVLHQRWFFENRFYIQIFVISRSMKKSVNPYYIKAVQKLDFLRQKQVKRSISTYLIGNQSR